MRDVDQTKRKPYTQATLRDDTATLLPPAVQATRDQTFRTGKSSVASKVLSRSRNRIDTIHPGDETQRSSRGKDIADIDYLVGNMRAKFLDRNSDDNR